MLKFTIPGEVTQAIFGISVRTRRFPYANERTAYDHHLPAYYWRAHGIRVHRAPASGGLYNPDRRGGGFPGNTSGFFGAQNAAGLKPAGGPTGRNGIPTRHHGLRTCSGRQTTSVTVHLIFCTKPEAPTEHGGGFSVSGLYRKSAFKRLNT